MQQYLDQAEITAILSFAQYNPATDQETETSEEGSLEQTQGGYGTMAEELIYYYHPDHLGTATYLTDINGLPYEFFLNLPFGETMAEQHSMTADYQNRWKFTGHELDRETGLYYAGARYYDPKLSIFLSVDPEFAQFPSWSPYNYTLNNPINLIDPDGRSPKDPPGKKKNSYPRVNHFFSFKNSHRENTTYFLNMKKETRKNNLMGEWNTDKSGSTFLNLGKKRVLDRLFKFKGKGLTPDKKGGTQEAIGKLVNKSTDIEIKYRFVNYSSVEGEEWYGDYWYNNFTDDITKVDFMNTSDSRDLIFFNENSTVEEAIFLKGGEESIFVNEMCKGEECSKIWGTPYISEEEFNNHKNLPTKDYDIRE